MQFYKSLFFPAIKQFDPEQAHDRTLTALEQAQRFSAGRAMLRQIAGTLPVQRPLSICGLNFPNVLGIAAGYDKDVRAAMGLGILGFGHVEVGTLTPNPQPGNPKPRIFRLPEDAAVINRMGFPNGGVETAVPRLLDSLQAKYLLISFPAKSLGGRSKGMVQNYEALFEGWLEGRDWAVKRFEFENELAFLVETNL